MASQEQQRDKMRLLLTKAGIPYKKLTVIIGGYIHIDCIGLKTCEKWIGLLSQFCRKVTHNEKSFCNKINRNLALLPTTHKGYAIHARV